MMLYPAIEGFLLGGGLIIAIGAQNAFILRQGLLRQHVFILSLIAALADTLLIVLGVAGMGALVSSNPDMLFYVTVGGAIFLACYAVFALRRALAPQGLETSGKGVNSLGKAISILLAFTFLTPMFTSIRSCFWAVYPASMLVICGLRLLLVHRLLRLSGSFRSAMEPNGWHRCFRVPPRGACWMV